MLSLLLRGALLYYGVHKSHTCQNNHTNAMFYFQCDLVNTSLLLIMIVAKSLNICVVLKIITQQSPVFHHSNMSPYIYILYVIMRTTTMSKLHSKHHHLLPLMEKAHWQPVFLTLSEIHKLMMRKNLFY